MASILLGFLSIYVECLFGAIFGLFPSSNLARRTDSGFCDVILLPFNYVLIFLNHEYFGKGGNRVSFAIHDLARVSTAPDDLDASSSRLRRHRTQQ